MKLSEMDIAFEVKHTKPTKIHDDYNMARIVQYHFIKKNFVKLIAAFFIGKEPRL